MNTLNVEIHDANITLETGVLARNANGSVVVRHGTTFVLATATADYSAADTDQFPLLVDYREKMSATGRIPGNFFRREMRPSDHETLTSRLIDRSIRPLFPDDFRYPVTVTITVYAADICSDLTGLSILAGSVAVGLSDIPFDGPVIGATVGMRNGQTDILIAGNSAKGADIDLIVSVATDGLIMLEGGSKEADGDTLTRVVGDVVNTLGRHIPTIGAFVAEHGKVKQALSDEPAPVGESVHALVNEAVEASLMAETAQSRRATFSAHRDKILNQLTNGSPEAHVVKKALHSRYRAEMRRRFLDNERLDGRSNHDVRPLTCRTGLLLSNHGSALFSRGGTQALVSTTLGGTREAQDVDYLEKSQKENFILHYNFPSFSVGRPRRGAAGPGRREIGHGHLARRALLPVLPTTPDWPFTIRVVSDILESDGSSSMASVCGASLALKSSGVPIKGHVAGIAMGVVLDDGERTILTDITAEEDGYGDMDLKLAGTQAGFTAVQLDTKRSSIPMSVIEEAFSAGRAAIDTILATMDLNDASEQEPDTCHAVFRIDSARVGQVIGSGGKNLQKLQGSSGARIEISRSGNVLITGRTPENIAKARRDIEGQSVSLRAGSNYQATIKSKRDYGIFVRIGDHEGLVHQSELIHEQTSDLYTVGKTVTVKVIGADEQGRLKLTEKIASA